MPQQDSTMVMLDMLTRILLMEGIKCVIWGLTGYVVLRKAIDYMYALTTEVGE